MGSALSIQTMLQYILKNEKNYWSIPVYTNKSTFSDQHAINEYALLFSHLITIDYFQQLVANFHVIAPIGTNIENKGLTGNKWKTGTLPKIDLIRICKGLTGTAITGCIILTHQYLNNYNTLYNNNTICTLQRIYDIHAPYAYEMSVLSTTPAIWHANGDMMIKWAYVRYADKMIKCMKRMRKSEHIEE